jgi:predicted HTH transcriptional regulator
MNYNGFKGSRVESFGAGVSRLTATRELQDVVKKDVLRLICKVGKGTKYILKASIAS